MVVPDEIRLLRRLLYCGEWIESHALHIFFLHAPDLLGYDGAIEMARDHRGIVESALRMKRAGNELMTVVGGRSVHPVNVRVGGFHRLPRREELLAVRPALVAAREEAIAAVPIVSGFEFPEFEQPYLYLSLDSSNGYPLESGALVTSAGLAAPVSRVRRARRRAARRALQRPALDVRRPALRGRPAGPLLAELRRALAPGARGCGGRRSRAHVPQPVQVDHRADRRADPRPRRGHRDHRRMARGAGRGCRRARPGGRGPRSHRGPARACCTTATGSTSPARSSTRRSSRRPRRTSRRSRPTCGRSSRRTCTCRTRS